MPRPDAEAFASEEYLNSFIDLNISPARVIQKKGALVELAEYLMPVGDRFAVVTRKRPYGLFRGFARPSALADERLVFECSPCCFRDDAGRIYEEISATGEIDAIVAIGGGTVIDTAKLVAFDMRKQLVTIPTSAATCAAFTALAVIYDRDGEFAEYEYLNKNPDICIIEPGLVMTSGARLTAAGFADTIAKFVEGEWSYSGKIRDYYSELGLSIAYKITNEVHSIGKKALADIEKGEPSQEAFEAISYNITASGLSSGISGMKIYPNIAHSVANGITAAYKGQAANRIYHGEGVAFGMAAGMMLMEHDASKAKAFGDGLAGFGLPVRLSDLMRIGAAGEDPRGAEAVAGIIVAKAMDSRESIHDIPTVTPELLKKAILETDQFFARAV